MFKDGTLRLLMTILGLERLEHDEMIDTDWVIPPSLTSDQLQESLDLLKKYTDEPISFENGKLPEEFIERKKKARKVFDSDDEDDNQEEHLFEPGGPTEMKPLEPKPKKPGKKRRARPDAEEDEELLDQIAIEKRRKRREREKQKMLMIKSALYVHDSDDESDAEKDAEFLLREQAQREAGPKTLDEESTSLPLPAISTGVRGSPITRKRKKGTEKENRAERGKKKRRGIQVGDEEVAVVNDSDRDEGVISRETTPIVPSTMYLSLDDDESEGPYTMGPIRTLDNDDDSDGPYTMGPIRSTFKAADKIGSWKVIDKDAVMNDAEEEEGDVAPRPGRGRRGPVIVDSDSE